jgi:MGT family glycosyltransferase
MSIDADAFLGRPDSCVVLIPRALQPNADRVGPRYLFTGPCVDTSRMTGWAPADQDPRPLAYVAFGTSYTDVLPIYRACVEALGASHRVVMATGKVDPAELGPLPGNVQAARTQPQLDVLAHADVFVTHAGMGSAAESLWSGVPTVAIPQAVDQFTNAAQLEAVGAGVQLPSEDVTADTLGTAVARAVERAPRARELRDEIRSTGGIAASADAVERFA